MSGLDRIPFWLLVAFLGVPGPFLAAVMFGGSPLQIMLTPIVGALMGVIVAYTFLREKKRPFSATWGEMRVLMKAPHSS
jgi:hypothetical protein